ncbi:cobA [Scenedesmus sp. PABB004]|nr:cobA [Scenedesmus sp. PABB004]
MPFAPSRAGQRIHAPAGRDPRSSRAGQRIHRASGHAAVAPRRPGARSARLAAGGGPPQGLAAPPASPAESSLPPGKAWLAGVGPGGWDHVTLKVARLISQADALVYDDLGAAELCAAAPPWAEAHFVGKRGGQAGSTKQPEIDALLVRLCAAGKRVVRLKGGCPSTFSRVRSEAAALAAAGCAFELVPGVSTATSAPVLAGLPLTDAALAGAYAVVSGHDAAGVDWAAFARIPTLVVLMGGRALPAIVQQLLATGWAQDTPAALVKAAGTPAQRCWFSTLARLERDTAPGAPLSPCVIVVGKVAGLPAAWAAAAPPPG